MSTNARRLRAALQLLVGAALLAWLLVSVSWSELRTTLASASPPLMIAACALYYLGVILSCWKWGTLLRLDGLHLSFARLFRWYLIGAFASNYLPTEIGGDLGRVLIAGRATGRPLVVARSILAERASGLLFMLALAWAGLAVVLGQAALALALVPVALVVAMLATLAARQASAFPFAPLLVRLWQRLPASLRQAVCESAVALRGYLRWPAALSLVAALSLAFQILAGAGMWLNLAAVGATLPLVIVVLSAAIMGVAGLLPITLNGWGVREGLFVALLTPFGATAGQALAAALLGRALLLLVTLPGALLLLLERRSPAPQPTLKP